MATEQSMMEMQELMAQMNAKMERMKDEQSQEKVGVVVQLSWDGNALDAKLPRAMVEALARMFQQFPV